MICFLVTTYERERSCKKLVKELTKYGDVYLVSDGSKYDIDKTWESKYGLTFDVLDHRGKKYYNETVNHLFKLPKKNYDYYFMIPDDFYPVDGFVEKAIKIWKSIKHPRKICLTTYISKSRQGKACWTKFEPVNFGKYWLTQWTDMCFMCEKSFFVELGDIPYSRVNYAKKPEASSGVGANISNHFYKRGWNIYQVASSLFVPQPEARVSKMNPWRAYNDPINIPVI